MTKQDYVIICGDFGGVWDGSKREKYWLDWLEDKPFTTLFVSGNHENYNLLSEYATEYWHGGKVQFIRPTIVHLMRGQVFDLCGKRFFTMGGASSLMIILHQSSFSQDFCTTSQDIVPPVFVYFIALLIILKQISDKCGASIYTYGYIICSVRESV